MNFEQIPRDAREAELATSGQLRLGQIIDKCEAIAAKGYRAHDGSEPRVRFDFEYATPIGIDSWRGIYAELALKFSLDADEPLLSAFIALLKSADGGRFDGYKGGSFSMDRDTPVWVANWSHTGNTAVIDVLDAGYHVIIATGYRET